jgi:hypothetical protein
MVKMGRPTVPKKDQRTQRITVPLNEAEYAQINAAAEEAGLPAATVCRLILLRETKPKAEK